MENKQTKQYILLLVVLICTGFTSAMYAGETISFETELTEPIYYHVVGNQSDLEGLNVSFNNSNITISTVINFKPDNFTLIFFNNITSEVEKIVYRSSGSSGTRYEDKIVIQNQTIYVPEYINDTKIIEVEKITDKIEVQETGFKLWHILLAMAVGGIFLWVIMYSTQKEKED